MAKNPDLKNIFESYYNNILLGEDASDFDTLLQNPNLDQATKDAIKNFETAKAKQNTSSISVGGLNIGGQQAPAQSAAPQSSATPSQEPTPDSSKKEERIKQLEVLLKTYGTNENTKNDPKVKALQAEFDALKTPTPPATTQPSATQASTQPTIGIQQPQPQTQSQSGVDVKIPSNFQVPQSTPQQGTPLQAGDVTIGKPEAAQETPQKQQAPSTKPATSGGSIVDYLASKGQATDKASRAKIAGQYGIQNYTGTAEQNTQLLAKMRENEKMPQGTNATGEKQYAAGTAPKATAAGTQQPKKQGMGGIVGGASKAAGSIGQGIKQATIGTKKPLGGILGGISKGIGAVGKGVKTALVGNQEEEEGKQYNESLSIIEFLKCISEKKYHQANINLNRIIQNKVKEKIASSIK